MRLTTRDVARIRELRYEDGLSGPAVAEIVGCSASSVVRLAPGKPGKIDNALLREAFARSGLGAAEVARRLGWLAPGTARKDGRRPLEANGSRVKRALGLLPQTTINRGKRYRFTLTTIDAETAALMAEAIGVMPWEIGA